MNSFHYISCSQSWPVIRITQRPHPRQVSGSAVQALADFRSPSGNLMCSQDWQPLSKSCFSQRQQPWVHPPQCHPPPQPHLPSKPSPMPDSFYKLIFISSHLINSGRLELSQHRTQLAGARASLGVQSQHCLTQLASLLLIWKVCAHKYQPILLIFVIKTTKRVTLGWAT